MNGALMSQPFDPTCVFCRIIAGEADRETVFWEDDVAICMLDIRPAKDGHSLLIPRAHHPTLKDMPVDLLGPLFERAQLLNRAVEIAFDADGSFSCYNTHVSQSVDHFHLHVIPRMHGDQLLKKGKWKRGPVEDPDELRPQRDLLAAAMRELLATANVS
jgi:histidine triad (HIT) family protein